MNVRCGVNFGVSFHFISYHFVIYFLGRACSTYGGQDGCIMQDFGEETRVKVTTWKTQA
jgi:hypothetical protein